MEGNEEEYARGEGMVLRYFLGFLGWACLLWDSDVHLRCSKLL